jgi:hypothetical protein
MTMTVNSSRTQPRHNAISDEEERAWVSFYRRAGRDSAIAAEVLAQLDIDPEMKREHLGLYLRCRESLRLHQARAARDQRVGQFVRWLLGGLFVRFPAATRRALGRGGDIAIACLPETGVEPAATQIQRLAKSPKVRVARAAFKATPAAASSASQAVSGARDASPQAVQVNH